MDAELNAAGMSLAFAALRDPVREKLERYGLIGRLDPDHFFPTMDAALDAFRGTEMLVEPGRRAHGRGKRSRW
jgi:hypothetical protein